MPTLPPFSFDIAADRARVDALLAKPHAVAAVGPRPVAQRRLSRRLLATLAATAPLILGMGLGNVLPDTGLATELAARVAQLPVLGSAPEIPVRQAALPVSIYLEVGRQADGSLDVPAMLSAWRNAGLPAAAAPGALNQVQALLPLFVGRHDPALEAQAVADAKAAAKALASAHPDVTLRLVAGQTVALAPAERSAWAGTIGRLAMDGAHDTALPATLASQRGHAEDSSMAHAEHAVARAVAETGLKAFRPSLWQMRSPEALADAAGKLQQANAELARATGWTGRVLGLDGRVALAMGPSSLEGLDAHVDSHTLDGTAQLSMQATWKSLGHEWFHAYDYALSNAVLAHPTRAPMTGSLQPLRQAPGHGATKAALASVLQAVGEGSPEWAAHRRHADATHHLTYFTTDLEASAYAFASHLNRSGASVLRSAFVSPGHAPERAPGAVEGARQAPAFARLFAVTATLNLAGGPAVSTPSLANWRQGRTVAAHPAPRSPSPSF